jgi:NitT/TauT family transport system permease protein
MSGPPRSAAISSAAIIRLALIAGLLGLWQFFSQMGIWNPLLFPSPTEVWTALRKGIEDRSLLIASAASLQRLAIGYGLSLAFGVPLGLLLGRNRRLDETIGSLALGLQALPSICWLPLAVLWFGLTEAATQFVVVMGSLMAVTLATRDGVNVIPPLLVRAGRVLGARGWQVYPHIIFPAALPAILTGAKLGWSFAWRSLMAAELLYTGVGLGSTLMTGRELHNMALVVAAMLIIMGIGLATDRLLFGAFERLLYARWGTLRQRA